MDELRKIDLNLLLTLHALLTEKHVTRAAVRLHRSQPAVSHALAQLRIHFNDPLLIRGQGGMTLSTRARGLLPSLEGALSELNALIAVADVDPATMQRRFRIAMSDYGARIVLPPLIRHLRQAAPGCDIAVSQAGRERMLAQLREGETDLALGIFPDASADIQKMRLFNEEFICLADGQFLPDDGRLSLDEWLLRPHVHLSMLPDGVDEIDNVLRRNGLRRHVCVALPHWSAAVSLLPGTDLVLTVASRSILPDRYPPSLRCFIPPLPLPHFAFEQAWHVRKEHDSAHRWLREATERLCALPVSE